MKNQVARVIKLSFKAPSFRKSYLIRPATSRCPDGSLERSTATPKHRLLRASASSSKRVKLAYRSALVDLCAKRDLSLLVNKRDSVGDALATVG